MGFIAAKCPSCGADIQLDDSRKFGFCNYCGAKVVQDKIVVEHRGSVQLDESEALKKLYLAARNAREASDNATALKHYEQISAKDPNSWEALFYSVILQLSSIKNAQISSAAMLFWKKRRATATSLPAFTAPTTVRRSGRCGGTVTTRLRPHGYGRAFIRTYYAISPTLVAWFGHTDWFKKLWRGKLDRMVESLRKDGVEDTPYNDKPW